MNRIGIDLGGTKAELLAQRADGSVALRERVPSPTQYGALLEALAALVARADAALGADGAAGGARTPVGVGAPGSPNPATGLHRNSNLTCMNGRPFERDLAAALGRPVRVVNDANCLALSEAIDGAGAGLGSGRVVFGVILGTGVGGGLVVDGRVVVGRNGVGGEWGHNPMPGLGDAEAAALPCYCGRFGCLEQCISGPALERRYAAQAGAHLPMAQIAARAGSDPAAAALLEHAAGSVARALGVVVNLCDPDAIVLGGGLSNIPGLAERVEALLPRWVFSDACSTPVRRAQHGDSSGIRGALRLFDA
ncbi:MAG: ROK family protein [Phycisphaerales bacterium]